MKIIDSKFALIFVGIFILFACKKATDTHDTQAGNVFASLFSVEKTENGKMIRIFDESGKITDSLHVTNVKSALGKTIRPNPKIVCLSTTHLAFLQFIGMDSNIVAVSNADFVYSPVYQRRISEGHIQSIGFGATLNWELLINLKPDLVTVFDVEDSDKMILKQLERFNIPYLIVSEYKEKRILGQSEWAKVFAALYPNSENIDTKLDSVFYRYETLAELTKNLKSKPYVMVNLPWHGTWHVAGKHSTIAQLITDAGGKYALNDDNTSERFVASFEQQLTIGLSADVWINTGQTRNIQEIIDTDKRFLKFKAVKTKQVFNRTKRVSENGGNDYMESGIVNPDIILRDLIKIFHPELLPDSIKLYYYEHLE